MITLQTVIQRNAENLLTSEVGEEMVMMDIEGGYYISLNKMGRVIWERLESPVLVSDLVSGLMLRFNVEQELCIADTLEYLKNMHRQKVITIQH